LPKNDPAFLFSTLRRNATNTIKATLETTTAGNLSYAISLDFNPKDADLVRNRAN